MKTITFTILILAILSCSTKNNHHIGLFDKLFGENEVPNQTENKVVDFDTTQLVKTSEMLDEDLYWTLIDKSLKNTSNQYEQERYLINEIRNLTPKQIVGFRLRTDKFLHDTYNSEMWCAGYIMNGGCSDDGFEYFRNWIISRGKSTYYSAKQNPDNLIIEVNSKIEGYYFEGFWYVALDAFKNKTERDLYDYVDEEKFKTEEGNYPQFEFTWQEDNPESMKKICPKLYEKLWKK